MNIPSNISVYEVGGCVRDQLLGVPTKDVDYTVVAPSFEDMRLWLLAQGFDIFVTTPETLTMRARFPKGMDWYANRNVKGLTGDFVLARKEGGYTDGRHPDQVEPGTLMDDLARRDFTVNAIAKDSNGQLIDPHNGRRDLENRVLRCVGTPKARFTEDALRAVRALRFMITKGLEPHGAVVAALESDWLPPLLVSVSTERVREELLRAFKHDTKQTMYILCEFPKLMDALFVNGLWLMPTLRE